MVADSMSEHEGWLNIAERLRELTPKAIGYAFGPCVPFLPSEPPVNVSVYGLCYAISMLPMTSLTKTSMMTKIAEARCFLKKSRSVYIWPLTVIGHQERRAFCLAQAERTAPGKNQLETTSGAESTLGGFIEKLLGEKKGPIDETSKKP